MTNSEARKRAQEAAESDALAGPQGVEAIRARVRGAMTLQTQRRYREDVALLLTALDESRAEVAMVRRGAQTLGHIVETQGRDALDASGMHHVIGEDGDGDWAVVWEVLAELRPRAKRAEARATAAEAVVASVRELARWLSAFDLVDMPVPTSVDVPDDYELGINDAGDMLNAALTPTTTETGDDHA